MSSFKIKTKRDAYRENREKISFIRERDEALVSLNYVRISNFMKKYNLDFPEDGLRFWISVHRARIQCPSIPRSYHNESLLWLRERGIEYLPQRITGDRIKGRQVAEGRLFIPSLSQQEIREIKRNL